MKITKWSSYFTIFERILWLTSVVLLIILYSVNPHRDILTLAASLIGATSLIFLAKGHVAGQILSVVFSLLYAVISFRFQYYGEMITYLGMTAPIAVCAAVQWLKHPCKSNKNEVEVASLQKPQLVLLFTSSVIVTGIFYFILRYFHTANLPVSTVSVTTSFLACGLMFLRSPFYAVAYACNDIVLILLWISASFMDISYLPMVLCFLIFLANDIYGFISWQRMKICQNS